IPEFKDRSSNQMIFISLVADRESPLRTIPEDKRRVKAAEIAGYVGREKDGRYDKNHRNLVEGKVEFVEKAIAKYRELQYDEDQEMLDGINRQIQEIMYLQKINKEEFCMRKKVKVFKDGSKEEEKSIDTKQLTQMVKDVSDMVKNLPELRQAKKDLLAQINADKPKIT